VATAVVIAFSVMFISGGLSFLEGLSTSTERAARGFDEGPMLVFQGPSLETSRIGAGVLDGLVDPHAAVRLVPVEVSLDGTLLQETYAVSVSNDTVLRGNLDALDPGDVWVGQSLVLEAEAENLTLTPGTPLGVATGDASLTLAYERVHPTTLLPDDWVLVRQEDLERLSPALSRDATFLLTEEGSRDLGALRSMGFEVVPTTGAVDFLRRGISQVAPALWGVALSGAAIVALLTFTLMNMEVRSRSREIRTIRQIGGSRAFIAELVLLQSAYVAVLGALLGIALGSVVANAISSFSALAGLASFILPIPTVEALLLPLVIAVASGLVGGLPPALRAARIGLAQEVPA
jgi:hypothetical protein